MSDPQTWVDRHGDYLFRCALLRVRDHEAAEELVQETFLAALHAKDRFAGRSSERSWMVGILKHKIIDHFKKQTREHPAEDPERLGEAFEEAGRFDEAGHWKTPAHGQTPGCKEVTRLLSESLDRPLPWRKRLGIRLHYLICVWCERYGQHIRFLQDAVRRHPDKLEGQDPPPPAGLSPEARDRMKRALRNRRDAR